MLDRQGGGAEIVNQPVSSREQEVRPPLGLATQETNRKTEAYGVGKGTPTSQYRNVEQTPLTGRRNFSYNPNATRNRRIESATHVPDHIMTMCDDVVAPSCGVTRRLCKSQNIVGTRACQILTEAI